MSFSSFFNSIFLFLCFLADKPDHVSLNISTNKVCAGTEVLFTCSAVDANPTIQHYTLHDNNSAGTVNTSSNQGGVFTQKVFMKGQHSYTCEAANSVGITRSSSSTVEVQGECKATVLNIFHTFTVLICLLLFWQWYLGSLPQPAVAVTSKGVNAKKELNW